MDSSLQSKINVLEIFSNLEYRGGQRNMISFAKYFRKDLFNVYVGVYSGGGALESVLTSLGISYVVANGDLAKIFTLIVEKKIDVIHIHRSGGYVAIETALIKGAKKINSDLVVVEKNVFGKYDATLEKDIDCSFFQSMMHLNERYLSASGLDFNFNKMKVLNNIVDDEEFNKYRASKSDVEKFKKNYGVSVGEFVVGKVAHPAIEKWSDLLIDMMPYLIKTAPNVKVIVIGAPQSRIKRIINGKFSDKFILLPQTNNQRDLHLFYQSIDVLAHCSKIGECNGNTINEAMYWKKPVVVNSTPRKDNGQLEQVLNNKNGFIANKPSTFARAIAYLLINKSDSERLGEEGFKQVTTINSPRYVVGQVEKFIFEKCKNLSKLNGLNMLSEYDSIQYYPTSSVIQNYRSEYQKRLSIDFGNQSLFESFVYWLKFPLRFYYKVQDFFEHKMISYVRK